MKIGQLSTISLVVALCNAQLIPVYPPQNCQSYMYNGKMAVYMTPVTLDISYYIYYTSETNGPTTSPKIYPGYTNDGSSYHGSLSTEFTIYLNDVLDTNYEVTVKGYYDGPGECDSSISTDCPFSSEEEVCVLPTPKPTPKPITPTSRSPTRKPTNRPTPKPTKKPTSTPSASPSTISPTIPSANPTTDPTTSTISASPTKQPSPAPERIDCTSGSVLGSISLSLPIKRYFVYVPSHMYSVSFSTCSPTTDIRISLHLLLPLEVDFSPDLATSIARVDVDCVNGPTNMYFQASNRYWSGISILPYILEVQSNSSQGNFELSIECATTARPTASTLPSPAPSNNPSTPSPFRLFGNGNASYHSFAWITLSFLSLCFV